MHTHCNGLTSAYLKSAVWFCVIAVWLLSSGFAHSLRLSCSMSTEKLIRAARSMQTAVLLFTCHDGLTSFSWDRGEAFKINPIILYYSSFCQKKQQQQQLKTIVVLSLQLLYNIYIQYTASLCALDPV